jgi:hypothetical protein
LPRRLTVIQQTTYQNISLNFSVTDLSLSSCWYAYNGTNFTIPCTNNNTLILGSAKTLIFYANDTLGNLASATSSWEYSVYQESITYDNPITEGDTNIIRSNFIFLSAPSSVYLNYSGTLYLPSISASGTNYTITSTLIAPIVTSETNKTFSYIFSGLTFPVSYNQTILDVAITTTCAGNFPFLNVTNYDEDNKIKINGTVQYTLMLSNSGLNLSTSNGSFYGNNYQLCSTKNLSSSAVTYSLELRYFADGYFYETYNVEAVNTSSLPLYLDLYFLNLTSGYQFKINYLDFNYFKHPSAIIQVQRQYLTENLYSIVELPQISSEGFALASFNTNNIRYKLIMNKDGIVLDTFENVYPECANTVLNDCSLELRGAEDTETTTSLDFTYTLTAENNQIELTYIIPSGTPKLVTLITNQTSLLISSLVYCNNSQFASGGTLICTYNDTIGDSFIYIDIYSGDDTIVDNGYIIISEDLSGFYLLNNYFIGFILLVTLGLMFFGNMVMLLIVGVGGIIFLGLIFLINKPNLVTLTTSILWLIVAVILAIYKISQKEERT